MREDRARAPGSSAEAMQEQQEQTAVGLHQQKQGCVKQSIGLTCSNLLQRSATILLASSARWTRSRLPFWLEQGMHPSNTNQNLGLVHASYLLWRYFVLRWERRFVQRFGVLGFQAWMGLLHKGRRQHSSAQTF